MMVQKGIQKGPEYFLYVSKPTHHPTPPKKGRKILKARKHLCYNTTLSVKKLFLCFTWENDKQYT